MRFQNLAKAVSAPEIRGARGPVALIIAEDDVEVLATLQHHAELGFKTLILCAPAAFDLNLADAPPHIRIETATREAAAPPQIINAIIAALPENTWVYYGFNAEFLFFPFCETRSIGEMLAFHAEERRRAMLTYVIDVYANDLSQADDAVSLTEAHFDKTGYYALAREGEDGPKDRQIDIFGGLRWRFEEHIPWEKRRIDRIGLVRTERKLTFYPNHTWSNEELNTYACPWHNNLTATVISFRTAKALRLNPASRQFINNFMWENSVKFEWTSQQLLDLGFMEPGQWF